MTLNLILAILPTPFFLGQAHFCESGKIIPVPNSFSNLSFLPFFFLFIFCFDKRIRDREREGALQPSSQAKPAPSAAQGPAGPCLLTLAAPFSRSHLPPAAPPSPTSAPHRSSSRSPSPPSRHLLPRSTPSLAAAALFVASAGPPAPPPQAPDPVGPCPCSAAPFKYLHRSTPAELRRAPSSALVPASSST